jgi:hypothetical protein
MGMFAFTGKDHYMVRSYRLKGMDREGPIYKLSPVGTADSSPGRSPGMFLRALESA